MIHNKFGDLVAKRFGYLIDEYNFHESQLCYYSMGQAVVEFRHAKLGTVIRIELERGGWLLLNVGLASMPQASWYSLDTVVEFLEPEAHKAVFVFPQYPGRPEEDMDAQLSRLASVVHQYCEPILSGHFSNWEPLREFRKQKLDEIQRKQGGEKHS